MKKMNKKGFTIVELVIVIAVIAILAAVLIPTFSGVITKANQSAVTQTAAALYKEAYALDLADGTLDGKEGTTAITSVAGKDVTYTASATAIKAEDYATTLTVLGADWGKYWSSDLEYIPVPTVFANTSTK